MTDQALLTRPIKAPAWPRTGTIHIERSWLGDPEDEPSIVIMLCGATAVVYPDGRTCPEGFDFYREIPVDLSDVCQACLQAANSSVTSST